MTEKMERKENIKFTISEQEEGDIRGVLDVFYHTWLATYPNRKFKILKKDIQFMFANRYAKDKLVKQAEDLRNLPADKKRYVAKVGNKVVGICTIEKGEKENRLRALYVLPVFQGNQIGASLMERVKSFFGSEKDIVVNLATYNENAKKFYEKHGFVVTKEKLTDAHFTMRNGAIIPEMEMRIRAAVKI